MRAKYQLAGLAVQFLVCCLITFGQKPVARADQESRLAVLETRADQIDTHLNNTDATVQRLWNAVQVESDDIAEMKGEGIGIGAVLTVLTGMNLIVVVRKGKEK